MSRDTELKELTELLLRIEEFDTQYEVRTLLVYEAVYLASKLGYKVGFRFDKNEEHPEKWPVAVIELPNIGEVAWHCAAVNLEYDGHSTKEKYKRIHTFANMY